MSAKKNRSADLAEGRNEIIAKGSAARRIETAGIRTGVDIHVTNLNDGEGTVSLTFKLNNRRTLGIFSDKLTEMALEEAKKDNVTGRITLTRS